MMRRIASSLIFPPIRKFDLTGGGGKLLSVGSCFTKKITRLVPQWLALTDKKPYAEFINSQKSMYAYSTVKLDTAVPT